jgi:OPA family glycerol-3-phosphate transporter-like MFS transporter
VATLLYGFMLGGAVLGLALITTPYMGLLVVLMSMAIIGVHGMLSGTASMDFGGAKNVGIAVGIIDGFVYLGTGTMALVYGFILPASYPSGPDCVRPDYDPSNWIVWPIGMIPIALIGFLLARKIWHATAKPSGSGGH